MYKTALKRKHPAAKRKSYHPVRHNHKSDLDKIKLLLMKTSQNWQHAAENKLNHSLENVKEKSAEVRNYVAKRPIRFVGFTLTAGLLAGFFIGYFIKK